MNVRNDVQDIFCEIFEDDELVISDEMTADDIPDWNSLTYMELISAIEEHFGFKFNTREIRHFKNIGDMLRTIEKKVGE